MLIEQIIEFQSRGPGPPDCTCTPTTGYFHDKTKISRKILEWIIIYCQIILQDGNAPYFPLSGPNHALTKFNSKIQNFKRALDLNRK